MNKLRVHINDRVQLRGRSARGICGRLALPADVILHPPDGIDDVADFEFQLLSAAANADHDNQHRSKTQRQF